MIFESSFCGDDQRIVSQALLQFAAVRRPPSQSVQPHPRYFSALFDCILKMRPEKLEKVDSSIEIWPGQSYGCLGVPGCSGER
jgi:hypothetical protein